MCARPAPSTPRPSDIGKELVPPKVGRSTTLGGGTVTGNRVGRSERVTGDEPGSCRLVTGDQYIDRGQYDECGINPQPEPPGTGLSITNKGLRVSGTQTGRSMKVTGDEPGTCKAITGTPYAGLEQAEDYCEPPRQREILARTRVMAATPGPKLTGIQPSIDRPRNPRTDDAQSAGAEGLPGGRITGAAKGACEPVTGTPYVGADQFAEACGGTRGGPRSSRFSADARRRGALARVQRDIARPVNRRSLPEPIRQYAVRRRDRHRLRVFASHHRPVRHGQRQDYRYRAGPF
jgi:hypothetical protein